MAPVRLQPVGRRGIPWGMVNYPMTTGDAAKMLGTTEPQLAETVRRGHVDPPPPILAGRRLWAAQHIAQARAALKAQDDRRRKRAQRR